MIAKYYSVVECQQWTNSSGTHTRTIPGSDCGHFHPSEAEAEDCMAGAIRDCVAASLLSQTFDLPDLKVIQKAMLSGQSGSNSQDRTQGPEILPLTADGLPAKAPSRDLQWVMLMQGKVVISAEQMPKAQAQATVRERTIALRGLGLKIVASATRLT